MEVADSYQNSASNGSAVLDIEGEDEFSVPEEGGRPSYDWRLFSPKGWSCWKYTRWLCVGGAKNAKEMTDEEIQENLSYLARCIVLLRQYRDYYGMPENRGGPKEQEIVLREVARDLYAGGSPLWALESVMQKAAEGMTGNTKVNWLLLPRKAFVCSHAITGEAGATTSMFLYQRGFDISKLDAMEKVAIRLASFASNTNGVGNIPSRFPKPKEFQRAFRTESVRNLRVPPAEELAAKILTLASTSAGIFFYLNSRGYKERDNTTSTEDFHRFWNISAEETELFTRLVTMEAMANIDEIDAKRKRLYSHWLMLCFRLFASAGACAFWFSGSWQDMIVAGLSAVIVAFIGESSVLSRQEKIIYETIASFVVGVTAGFVALTWPEETCFRSMAVAGVLHILQGFRVVFAIIEIMSKHTVAGGADLLEGILFTGLIASFLRFGQYTAAFVLENDPADAVFSDCTNGINRYWYILLVPLASLSWSGLFNPEYYDLIPMCLHGTLAYGVNYALNQAGVDSNLNNFVSAAAVTVSAGLYSRFTGRQAVGNAAAGLYALVPGAYLVNSIFNSGTVDGQFFADIVQKAVGIGIGAWTGSMLCSPTLLGATRGLFTQQSSSSFTSSMRRDSDGHQHPATMLYF